MATQMIIRLDANLKNKVSHLAKAEGKNLSALVRFVVFKNHQEYAGKTLKKDKRVDIRID